MSRLWIEAWKRPGHATFGRVRDYLPYRDAGCHLSLNRVGDGNLELPDTFDGFGDLLLTDKTTPANSVSSLIRLYSEEDPTSPIAEWLPTELFPSGDKDDPWTKVTGVGINAILGYARTEAWDWDGSDNFVPEFPDWIYGGTNILGNPGFEDSPCRPEVNQLTIWATGGTFNLSNGVDNTDNIAYNANANTIEQAIEDAAFGPVADDVLVTGTGTPTEYQLEITATGGTYTISDGTDTTSAIAWNASAATIKTRLETDIAAIGTVSVSGSAGSFTVSITNPSDGLGLSLDDTSLTGGGATWTPTEFPDPFVIEFVNPCTQAGGLILISGGLIGGSADIIRTQFGALQPSPWTKSQVVSSGTPRVFGEYDSFRVTTAEAHTGTFSLLIDPAPIGRRFAGAQQVLNVKPGGLYQASVWVKTNSASQEYRFVIRGVDEDLLLDVNGAPALQQLTLTSGVWTQFSIPDVLVGDNEQIILRIANINVSGNPAIFYVDDGVFAEGQAAATIGKILGDLYADATVDHVADGRFVWENEAVPGTPYLRPDFTDALDSAGAAWADSDIAARITMRFSYSQVMAWAANEHEYEYRIVPDDPEAGLWLWQVYNPGTMDAAPDVAIQGGASDVRRQLRRQAPGGTDVMVEGLERITARARNAGLVTALGRIEASTLSREATGQTAVTQAAVSAIASELADIESVGYVLTGTLQDEPLSAYVIGDTVTIVDPPEITALALRCVDVEISISPKAVQWECQFGAVVTTNADAAIADAVAGLLQRFEYPDVEQRGGPAPLVGGGGGMAHILIVSTSESDTVQAKADYVVNQGNAAAELQAIFDSLPDEDWSIWMAGIFELNQDVTTPSGAWIRGLGYSSGGT